MNAWLGPVPLWACLVLSLGFILLFRLVWVEIGLRARQIRILRDERERERRDFAEWNARWNERHPGENQSQERH